jgi:hypothetical protein
MTEHCGYPMDKDESWEKKFIGMCSQKPYFKPLKHCLTWFLVFNLPETFDNVLMDMDKPLKKMMSVRFYAEVSEDKLRKFSIGNNGGIIGG